MAQKKLNYEEISEIALKRSRTLIQTDPELHSIMPDKQVYLEASQDNLSCDKMIDGILKSYANRKAVGMRHYTVKDQSGTTNNYRHYLPEFSKKTYGDLRQDIHAIANCWHHIPALSVNPDEFVAIIGFASSDYLAIDCATSYAQAVSVPLQSASSGADLNDIFERIQPTCLATSFNDLDTASELAKNNACVRSLIAFDIDIRIKSEKDKFEEIKDNLKNRDIQVLTYEELIKKGQAYDFNFLPPHPEGDEQLALIIHSSGSTGVPKGAMISARTVKQYWVGNPEKYPSVAVIFSPLNHILGRASLLQTLGKGSFATFTLASDMSTLFEDIRLTRPTWLTFFPRVLDMIYQHYQNEVVKKISSGENADKAREIVMSEMGHSFLGDRLTTATVGSAPTSQAVKDFMAQCFKIRMWDGYGSTEAGSGSVTINGMINRRYVIDYKLRDVPELGYYQTDKPYPRGEFCFKGRNQIKGFYKDAKATNDLLTDDGFIITGDIVEERDKDRIVIVDRRKDVVKLSQGEYVAVGPLGAVFEGGSPYIKQIYIYGNSHRSYLVAVIVPDIDTIHSHLDKPPTEIDIRNIIRTAIQDVAKNESLKTFEAPRDFIIEHEPFSQNNGLLSSVRKKLRPALKRQYGEALDALYDKHEQGRDDAINALKDNRENLTPEETLKRLLIIHLGLEDDINIPNNKNFSDLGGDSLGAVNYSLLIEDVFDIVFPADKILDPTADILSWARNIEQIVNSDDKGVSFASIHGKDCKHVEAQQLDLNAFISKGLISNAPEQSTVTHAPKVVLLTGATGFLGRHVCLEWLSKLTEDNSELICLVRAKDNNTAKQRLVQIFERSEPALNKAFKSLSKDKLTVLAADIAMPNLGLDLDTFKDLTHKVDRICHVGALVNHRLSYEHLFAPNVVGTSEIIKLALSEKKKPIDFVSTVSVLPLLERDNPDQELACPLPQVPLSNGYAAGYATSKWAAEILLRNASNTCNLPINILRGNMMLAHRDMPGAVNPSDMFTRLLYSLIITGIAPQSFYKTTPTNYDGLPVDIVASSVVNVRQAGDEGVTMMNIHNYNEEAHFSLDSIVDYISEAGYPIEKITDYQDWYRRFSERLHTLPENDKQKSALDLLAAFKHPQLEHPNRTFNNFSVLINKIEGEIPHLERSYISKILEDMALIGLLPD